MISFDKDGIHRGRDVARHSTASQYSYLIQNLIFSLGLNAASGRPGATFTGKRVWSYLLRLEFDWSQFKRDSLLT